MMDIEQVNQQVIVNEWQLGQQLNVAVHNGAREKFNLLLSFLSNDVRDFAQFDLKAHPEAENKNKDLRAQFHLPKAQPLVNEGPTDALLAELNDDLQQTKMHEIRFKQLLTNEAILARKSPDVLPQDILDNLPLIKQQRVIEAYCATSSDVVNNIPSITMEGVDAQLLDEYQHLALDKRPVRLNHYS